MKPPDERPSRRPLRIAVATEVDLSQPYGHVVHLSEMLSSLAKLGPSISVFVPDLHDRPDVHVPSHDNLFEFVRIKVPAIPKVRLILYEFLVAWEIIQRGRRTPWDLIYTRSDLYSFGGWLASLILRKPHVLELNGLKAEEVLHSGGSALLAHMVRLLEGFLSRLSKRVVVVTKGLRHRVVEVHRVPQERCSVIENGVDTNLFHPGSSHLPAEPLRVVFAGQLTRNQGIGTLLRAAKRLGEGTRITVVGDGPEMEALRREHQNLGLGDHVVFRGSVSYRELPEILRTFHVGVAPYTEERNDVIGYSSIKVFAYLSCGLPAVASRLPGLESLDEWDVGMTVPPDDPEALAEALETLRRDPSLRRQMSHRARSLAVQRLDWKLRAKELHDVISEVVREATV